MYSLINLDLHIFVKSNGVYSCLFWINVGISRPSRRTWWLLLTLKYKDNRCLIFLYEPCGALASRLLHRGCSSARRLPLTARSRPSWLLSRLLRLGSQSQQLGLQARSALLVLQAAAAVLPSSPAAAATPRHVRLLWSSSMATGAAPCSPNSLCLRT
jgi:hypothetical protein